MTPPKIALFLPLQEHGHILPTFKLASRLARDGWRVFYLAQNAFKPLVEERGFATVPMPEQNSLVLGDDGKPIYDPDKTSGAEKIAGCQAAQEQLYKLARGMLAQLKPAAVFIDLFFSDFAQTALQTGTPVAVYHTCLDAESFQAPPLIRKYGPPRNAFAAARQRLDWIYLWKIHRARRLRKEYATRIRTVGIEAVCRERGVPMQVSSMCTYGSELNAFVLGPAALSRRNLPDDRYFGFSLPDDPPSADTSFPVFERELPVVYCSFGSMSARYASVYPILRDTIATFRAEGKFNLIAQVGVHYDKFANQSGGNIHIERFAPQTAYFKRVDAVITHGGYGSLKECVAHHRPMLVIPFYQDQFGGARRSVELGIAQTLDHRSYDARRAHRIVERLIAEPGPRQRLAQLYSPAKDAEEFERAYASLLRRLGHQPSEAALPSEAERR